MSVCMLEETQRHKQKKQENPTWTYFDGCRLVVSTCTNTTNMMMTIYHHLTPHTHMWPTSQTFYFAHEFASHYWQTMELLMNLSNKMTHLVYKGQHASQQWYKCFWQPFWRFGITYFALFSFQQKVSLYAKSFHSILSEFISCNEQGPMRRLWIH
jgi:hypothetical protein